MPALAAVLSSKILARTVATTSATVSVDATYSPDGLESPGVMRWVDRSGGIQAGYPNFTLQMRKPTKDSRMTWTRLKFNLPTMEVTAPTTVTGIQPAPKKAYDHQFVGTWYAPERGTLAERLELFNRVAALLFDTIVASDGAPSDSTASPLYAAAVTQEPVFGA